MPFMPQTALLRESAAAALGSSVSELLPKGDQPANADVSENGLQGNVFH